MGSKFKKKKPPRKTPTKVREKENPTKHSTNLAQPIFSLHYLQSDFCITICGREDQARFLDKLVGLSRLTWQQISSSGRHKMGTEIIPRSAIIPRIPSSIPKDAPLLAFRFSGLKPMVGFRSDQIFHIIWFEREFDTLYKHS